MIDEKTLEKMKSMKTAEEMLEYVKKEKISLSSEDLEAISGGSIRDFFYINCKSCGTRFYMGSENCPSCGATNPIIDALNNA